MGGDVARAGDRAGGGDLHLGVIHRDLLATILRDHPGISNGQVGAIFERKTGRRLARKTVLRARRDGYVPAESRGDRHLTGRQQTTLEHLIREAGPGLNAAEVARQFAAFAGRTIDPARVRRVAGTMGVAVGPPGARKGERIAASVAAEVARAARAKAERSGDPVAEGLVMRDESKPTPDATPGPRPVLTVTSRDPEPGAPPPPPTRQLGFEWAGRPDPARQLGFGWEDDLAEFRRKPRRRVKS